MNIDPNQLYDTAQIVTGQEASTLTLWAAGLTSALLLGLILPAVWRLTGDLPASGPLAAVVAFFLLVGFGLAGPLAFAVSGAVVALGSAAVIRLRPSPKEKLARERPRHKAPNLVSTVLVCALGGLLATCLVPQDDTHEGTFTEVAHAEVADAEQLIQDSIVAEYDVDVVSISECHDNDRAHTQATAFLQDRNIHDTKANQEHATRANWVNDTISASPGRASKVQVLTDDGILGCYGVLYDNATGEAKLIVDADQTELPAPGRLAH